MQKKWGLGVVKRLLAGEHAHTLVVEYKVQGTDPGQLHRAVGISIPSTLNHPNMPTSAELKEHYDAHGYVIIPGLLTPSEHADLLAATNRVVARTRSGSWPHARVVGKQFPPYGIGDDIWGVQHAMHPALEEPIFARWYAGDAVRGTAKMLLGCRDEELQMGGFPPPPPRPTE